jgi:capsid protein
MSTRPRRTKLEVLRDRHEAARLTLDALIATKRASIIAKYDATESTKARRKASVEVVNEGEIYSMSKRLLGCNLGRDLARNYSPARGVLHQMRVNVVGALGKLTVNGDKTGEATGWFNEAWSKDCDYREDCDWSTMLQNILEGVQRDGDVLAVVDDNLIGDGDTGKLLTWESDQIAPLSDQALAKSPFPKATQDNGILRDDWGRILAYVATGKRGLVQIPDIKDATIWKREVARLVRNPWRLNQGRGVPSLITPATNFIDLYEILASELASTKKAIKQYAFVKRSNAVTDWDSPATGPEFLPENDGRTAAEVVTDGANQTTHTARNYEKIEALTGGLTDYIDPDDEVIIPDLKHPSPQLQSFLDAVHGYGGAALGMAAAYTRLRADSSYTAFRGDMIMTWVTFRWLQKMLERTVADWVAVRVLRWAQRKKLVAPLPAGWERTLSWTWPKMPEVNEVDAQTAIAAALKNGTTSYSELLGPEWEKLLRANGAQIDVLREINYPAGVLELKSGGSASVDAPAADDDATTKGTRK